MGASWNIIEVVRKRLDTLCKDLEKQLGLVEDCG